MVPHFFELAGSSLEYPSRHLVVGDSFPALVGAPALYSVGT